jgi:hypothetical protein
MAIMYLLDEEAQSFVYQLVEHHSFNSYLARDRFSAVHVVVQHHRIFGEDSRSGIKSRIRRIPYLPSIHQWESIR